MNIRSFTLSRRDDIMEGWPDLIRTGSGRLLCAYNECTAHANRDRSFIVCRTSDDEGETWSGRIQVGGEGMHGSQYNSIRLTALPDGRIWLTVDRIVEVETDPRCEIHIFESRDDGETWSAVRNTGLHGYCTDKVRVLPDGSLLLLVSAFCEDIGKSAIFAHISRDGGLTWSSGITAAKDPRYFLIEPAALVMPNGDIVAFIRENSLKGHPCMKAISRDGGLTWDGVYEHDVPCCHRPSVGFLHDGRIFMTYRHCTPDKRDTYCAVFDIASAYETDMRHQKVSCAMIEHESAVPPDAGYTGWVEKPDGGILVVNYVTDDAPKPFIRGYHLSGI